MQCLEEAFCTGFNSNQNVLYKFTVIIITVCYYHLIVLHFQIHWDQCISLLCKMGESLPLY